MKVKKSSTYALLGASGCGKTSAMSVFLGRLIPASGSVSVLGQCPGEPSSSIPGPDVGYSPREIALFPELSISETLNAFGQLHRMDKSVLEERKAFFFSCW